MSKKDADQLVRDLHRFFAETDARYSVIKRGGHWHVVNEDGASLCNFATTPGDHRFRQNAITQLRRQGIVPPGWRS